MAGSKRGKDARSAEREDMVIQQLERRGIRAPRVLEAMRKVPRHLFFPSTSREHAYEDGPWPIGCGQTISQPYIVALMSELLSLIGNEKVLEIGTGSGYQTAVLAELSRRVHTIETHPELSVRARDVLKTLGYDNVRFRVGDGYDGWPEAAPFDAILLTAAPDDLPLTLVEQLKIGGILVAPVGGWDQRLVRARKTERGLKVEPVTSVRFVPMVRHSHENED